MAKKNKKAKKDREYTYDGYPIPKVTRGDWEIGADDISMFGCAVMSTLITPVKEAGDLIRDIFNIFN